MSAKEYKKEFLNYEYELNGKKYNRKEAVNKILAVLDIEAKTIKELSAQFEIAEQPLSNLIKVMRENNIIRNTKLRRAGYYLFKSHNDCLLAKLLYPSAKEVASKFKVKGITKRTVEDAPICSHQSKYNTFCYSDHHLNTIYYSDGE